MLSKQTRSERMDDITEMITREHKKGNISKEAGQIMLDLMAVILDIIRPEDMG